MSQPVFKKATRKKVKLKLAITGPTGSGKTYSALRIAKGLGGKIAVIDTENGSASLYAEQFDFDVLEITPPFTTQKYIDAINTAEKGGYGVVVIDSLSHAWSGEGGLLQQKSSLDARPGSNHFANWRPIDKQYSDLNNAFLHSTSHILCTMRSKMEYSQVDDGGKKKIQKMGMAPIYREGIDYEFTVVFDVAMNHECETSKDRTGLFVDKIFKITEDTGATILKWLDSAAASEPVAPVVAKVTTETTKPVVPQSKPTFADDEIPIPPIPVQLHDDGPFVDEPNWEDSAADYTGSQPPVLDMDEPVDAGTPTPSKQPTLDELRELFKLSKMAGWTAEQVKQYMVKQFKCDRTNLLSRTDYEYLISVLQRKVPFNLIMK